MTRGRGGRSLDRPCQTGIVPTIRSHIRTWQPDAKAMRPCVWCGQGTDVMAETPGRPDLGHAPLHITCGVAVIRAYERLRAGRVLDATTMARFAQYSQRQIGSGE